MINKNHSQNFSIGMYLLNMKKLSQIENLKGTKKNLLRKELHEYHLEISY